MNRKPITSRLIKLIGAVLVTLTPLSAPPTKSSTTPPTRAPFCACCAEMGLWELESRKVADYDLETLNALKLDGVAGFYSTEAWPNDILGVSGPVDDLGDELVVSIVREQHDWKFFFKTKGARTGALVLTMPVRATFFKADTGEGSTRPESANTAGIYIYKELRFEGAVRGTGVFAKGIVPKTKFRLVLQGGGNSCLTAEDFHRWNLRISGPRAGYSIYGSFAKRAS